jgi:type IV secretion system protein VirB9
MALRASALLFGLAFFAAGMLHAETVPPRGAVDARVRVVQYVADEVYRLAGFVGYAIHIELEPGEEYLGLGAGDSEAITVDARDNDLFLKPRALAVATNLTLVTNRRRYHFEYRASTKVPDPAVDEVIYSLRFLYPPMQASEATRVDTSLSTEPARARNIDYWYCGHPVLRPAAASDDGVHTRIRFSSKGELPAIFVRNEDASESLLNFSVDPESGEIVIHRVAPTFILRRGRVVGCIVNRGYVGSGERLPSGTVSPDVHRRIRGTEP